MAVRRPKSGKRRAFEAACTAAGLEFAYVKAGLALVSDPQGVPDASGDRGLAVVRLRAHGHGLAARDLPAMRMLAMADVQPYVWSPDVGFVKLSRARLGFSPLVTVPPRRLGDALVASAGQAKPEDGR